jgi:hypothetical protein
MKDGISNQKNNANQDHHDKFSKCRVEESHPERNQGTGIKQTLKSVLMGFIGIQSSKDHQRDFEKGKPSDFIIAGVVMTLLFILTVYWVVSSALEDAGM